MKSIPLTQGQVALVDEDDYELLSLHKWCAHFNPKTRSFYAIRGAKGKDGKWHTVWMSRVITGAPVGVQVDHKNGVTLDNRKSNLRIASASEQGMNRKIRTDNKTGVKGVCRKRGKFFAYIFVNGTRKDLGLHSTLESAAQARRKAAEILHGEFQREG